MLRRKAGVAAGGRAGTVEAAVDPEGAPAEAPLCPKCGKVMVVRIGRREGPHFGERFWGCAGFPRCRGVREAIGERGG